MITNKELNAVKLSPTKKDFYQIWNELLDTAGKISDRWDPTSTNESDPGIVLLKVLTAVADKLNYNIDANTLEAFMPSAAQEESMRKLTEMLGYNMKYYQSATTEVKISYNKNTETPIQGILVIDKFTNLKDIDDSINYVTLAPLNLTSDIPFGNVECMEGELVLCETADNNIVSLFHLDDNHRYFLPETQVAENSIFITNIENNLEGDEWRRVTNLNAQSLGAKVFKFGFDSQEGLPYIQFPEDISTIIEDGLRIKYIRTSGRNGNISVNTLTKLTAPASWANLNPENKAAYHDTANFTVSNIRAASNGADKEGINSAYNNFKKTIGTFDTLVTCRDYMNKIYQLVSNIDNTTPLVSNVIVSDIKSDINRSVTLGTFTTRGVEYKVMAKPGKTFTNFDLLLYPFKSTYGLNSKQEFDKSFTYDESNVPEILTELENSKTLAHNIISPSVGELACIKNYYRIKAKINTIRKVGTVEQANILNNVYKKLFETFNMRQLDFGEEIPYDAILKTIETADTRIKSISLDEPTLTTKFRVVRDEKEYSASDDSRSDDSVKGNRLYNSLVLNNVLAGRVPLFNYNTNFVTDFSEKHYSAGSYQMVYPTDDTATNKIHKLKTEFVVPTKALANGNTLKLTDNEVIQFKAPNLKTTVTYPAYVNYYFQRDKAGSTYTQAVPATMQTLRDFLKGGPNAPENIAKVALEYYVNNLNLKDFLQECVIDESLRLSENEGLFKQRFEELIRDHCALFTKTGNNYTYVQNSSKGFEIVLEDPDIKFYALVFNKGLADAKGTAAWNTWLINLTSVQKDHTDTTYTTNPILNLNATTALKGFYKVNGSNFQGTVGYLIDQNGLQFRLVESAKDLAESGFDYYYVPRLWATTVFKTGEDATEAKSWHTANGLGQNAVPYELTKGVEYELKPGEYLLINYTQSKESNSDETEVIYKTYSAGTIIKPNFALADSEDWHQANHSYTKLNVASKFAVKADLPGMFTLGTNEQIEVRELMQVQLNEKNTNLYWEIPGMASVTGGILEFPFDEDFINKATGQPWKTSDGEAVKFATSYTLKEGEYLYYTDINKSDIAYYGMGTTITRGINTPPIFKYTSDDLISTEEIATNGINAAIPWRNYDLSGTNKALTIIENQFINLTAGDTLTSITLAGSHGTIGNDYLEVTDASWKTAVVGEGQSAITSLPKLDLTSNHQKWRVRSKLNLSFGPNKAQTLRKKAIPYIDPENPNNNTTVHVIDRVYLINTSYNASGKASDRTIETLEARGTLAVPLSIRANKFVQSSTTITDVTEKKLAANGQLNVEEIIADLQIKLFETETVKNNYDQIISLGNYGDGSFTSLNFEEQLNQAGKTSGSVTFDLNLLVPEGNFGLLMFYYQRLDPTVDKQAFLLCKINNSVSTSIKHFDEPTTTYQISLRDGINIIQINKSSSLTISSNTNNKAVITFGMLDLVDSSAKINPKLCYKAIDESTPYEQILKDIKAIDVNKEFYYNMPIAQNLDIDMNPKDETDTLENPLNWFNYNNINNKFVIAEIDTERLTDDIIIAKSSRSNF